MIKTLLADKEPRCVETLKNKLNNYCPQLDILGVACSLEDAYQQILDLGPELVFIERGMALRAKASPLKLTFSDFETIILSSTCELREDTLHLQASGYLFKPVQVTELLLTVSNAQHWIQLKKEQLEIRKLLLQLHHQSPPHDVIGIPTLEGIEFLKIREIVRFEGLKRYTRVVTLKNNTIISSYNIGEFRKLLNANGFFAPHKSHLVNLRHIRKLNVEGTLVMGDGSCVPVSRRKKSVFLQEIKHF